MDDRETLKDNYPSNSRTRRQEKPKPEEKKVESVVTSVVKKQKPSFGKRVSEFLFEDDTRSVAQYVVQDILLPAAKAMLSDAVGGGLDRMLFGERGGGGRSRRGGGSYVNYGSYSNSSIRDDRRDSRDRDRRDISRAGRIRHDFDELVFDSRGEAEEVLSRMVDLVQDFGMVSVADFYELAGITANFTDNKFGWDNLDGVRVMRGRRGGYIIDLPRPMSLD